MVLQAFTKFFDELYDSQLKEGGIEYPHEFDKKVLLPVPSGFLSGKIPETIFKDENKLSQYIELLPIVYNEEGKKIFMPFYGKSRIEFINELTEKWKYDHPILKEIIQREEFDIDEIWTTEDLAYDDVDSEHEGCNKLKFYTEYLKKMSSISRGGLKYSKSFSEKEKHKKTIKNINKSLKKIGRKPYDALADSEKEHIDRSVFTLKWLYEFVRWDLVRQERAKLILGFSPDVFLNESSTFTGAINDLTKKHFSSYPYILEYNQRVYAFGDWDFDRERIWCSFFSTPEFIITDKEGGDLVITIRDPQKVNVRYLRRIEKVYSKVREKRKYPASSWGEKSGRKRMLKERDRILQMHYRQLRDEKPSKSAELQLQRVIDQLSPEYGSISLERAKRIVYKRE